MPSYLRFANQRPSSSSKTWLWDVISDQGRNLLGFVQWHGAWREYCYYTQDGIILDAGCMQELASFCEQQTKLHNQKPKAS